MCLSEYDFVYFELREFENLELRDTIFSSRYFYYDSVDILQYIAKFSIELLLEKMVKIVFNMTIY